MSTPVNGSFRNIYLSPAVSVFQRDLTLLQCTIEAKETSYDSTMFTNIIDALETIRGALDDVQTANGDGSNPS